MMYSEPQKLTLALSIEAIERTIRAENALRMYSAQLADGQELLRPEQRHTLHDAIRHAIALTLLRLAKHVEDTDIDFGGPIVHVSMTAPKGCFTSELHLLWHTVEVATVACVMRDWLGHSTPFDPLESLPGL